MSVRFYNGRICTLENGVDFFEGELWVRGGKVAYAGPAKPADAPFGREIDLRGNLLLPGFKNAHTHSAMTFLRSYADDLPLLDWLEKQVFPMEAKLKAEDVYWLTRLAILEYVSGGITANMDMYMFGEASAKAAVDSGFRSVICGVTHNFVGSPAQLEADYEKYSRYHPLISPALSFHAEYTCSPGLLEEIAGVVHRLQKPIYMHSSESAREVRECLERTGKTPTAWMNGFGLFDCGGGAYHCVHMTDEDLQIMREKNMAVISCPGSNTKLASGIARLVEMRSMGIAVALGTDGPSSNSCLDFFREMFLATGLQKLKYDDAAALPADEVLRMACGTGAEVMGLPYCASLAAGNQADLMVIDLAQPNMQPLNHPLKNLVYSGCKQNVQLTMVAGNILYEQGVYNVGEDPAEIYRQANRIIAAMQ